MLTLLAALALATAPQKVQLPPIKVCPAIYVPPIAVTLVTERGQVLGRNLDGSPSPLSDQPNGLQLRWEGVGLYTLTVKRQWYNTIILRQVRVETNECGIVRPTPLTIRLQPVAGAPIIRHVAFQQSELNVGEGMWPFVVQYTVLVDAPAGQREVIWSSSNPGVATIDQTGTLRLVCRKEGGWTTITATSKADLTRQARQRFFSRGEMICPRGNVDR